MMNDTQPSGSVADALENHGDLAHQYFQFLQATEPVEHWKDVVALNTPIAIDKTYPVDWNLVRHLAASCPPLAGVMEMIEDQNAIAPRLGFRYAWSRFAQHAHLLDALEELFDKRGLTPNIVIEPGCFTGGLLHFLAKHWENVPHIGFDLSPVALDVCSHYSDLLNHDNPPLWLEGDFTQVTPNLLPDDLGSRLSGGLVLLSNIIELFGRQFLRYPYLEHWSVKSRIISYWVNQGAFVVLCERHDDPDDLLKTIVNNAIWDRPGCKARILSQFEAFTTTDMMQDNPLGKWVVNKGCVLAFSPSPAAEAINTNTSRKQKRKARR